MVVLHMWMVLREMKRLGDAGLAQALFDRFCSDMDHNLRELGTGDLAVPRRMQEFGQAFYGRSAAYDYALAAGGEPLAQALCKNIFIGQQIEEARQLAAYVGRAVAALAAMDQAKLSGASWRFPSPAHDAVPG
jgi:cytochrome b pre-mRNA-processing protein 3